MKALLIFPVFALALVVTGCTTPSQMYSADGKCITCFYNPITKKPINNNVPHPEKQKPSFTDAQEEGEARAPAHKKRQLKFNVPVNVDVAFLNIKREFEFLSESEVRKEWGSHAELKISADEYQWYAVPSVTYKMGSARKIHGKTMNLVTIVDKISDQESRVTVNYWPQQSYADSLLSG